MNNSMINPSVVDLLKKVEDRYSLVIVTSRRARQIIDGVKKHQRGKILLQGIGKLQVLF